MLRSVLSLALLTLFSSTATAIEIDTAHGSVELAETPHPLVVYNIGSLDTLLTLGVDIEGVADNPYRSHNLPGEPVSVGSVFHPDIETIAALQPALIIVGERSRTQYDVLHRIAPTIDLSIGAKGGAYILQNGIARARQLAALYNKTDLADKLIEQLESSRDATRQITRDSGSGLIVLVNGRAISLLGKDSLIGWIVQELELNLLADKPQSSITGIEPISFEYLAAKQPDWLIVIDRGHAIGQESGISAAALLDNPLVAQTPAAKNKRIIYLDGKDALLAIGGLGAMQRILDQLGNAFAQ